MSYRDPNLAATYAIYEGAPEYVETFDCSDRDMNKYIIGTIRGRDMPLEPYAEGEFSMGSLMSGVTEEMMQQDREEILATRKETIRVQAGKIRQILATGARCTVGSENVIKENQELFLRTDALFARED